MTAIELEDEKEDFYYSPEALREAVLESEEDIRSGRIHTLEEIRALHPRL
ncbi:hypothetical protein M2133_002926 [Parabacteroides sp. PF5-6]|nr:hypothetical protein [Parabacteroides sp. PF5-6]